MVINIKLAPCGCSLDPARDLKLNRFSGCSNRDDCENLQAMKKLIKENISVFEKFKAGPVSVSTVELGFFCPNYVQ